MPGCGQGWTEANHTLEESKAELQRLTELADRVLAKSLRAVSFRLIRVDATKALTAIIEKTERMRLHLQVGPPPPAFLRLASGFRMVAE